MNDVLKVEEFMKIHKLKPMDISQERFDKIVEEKYTYEVFVNRSLYKDVVIPFFMVDGELNYAFNERPNGMIDMVIVSEDYKMYIIREEDIKFIYLQNSEIFNDRMYEYSLKANGGKMPTEEQILNYE